MSMLSNVVNASSGVPRFAINLDLQYQFGRGLVVSADPSFQSCSADALRSFSMAGDICFRTEECEKMVAHQKYEIILLDSNLCGNSAGLVQKLRANPSSRSAVLAAVSEKSEELKAEANAGALFAVPGPATRASLERLLRAAYGLIIRERRRYFRCPVSGDVIAHRNTEGAWRGKLVNISEGGFCFASPVTLTVGQLLQADLKLPDSSIELSCQCKVQWTNLNGRAGVQFRDLDKEMKTELQHWLGRQLERALPAVARALRTNV